MREFVYFWLFDYLMSYKKSNKKKVIENLYKFNGENSHLHLSDLRNYFPPYVHLLDLLINDHYISKKDREYITKLRLNVTNNTYLNETK